ncbi:hypothetical protein GLAREA_09312 [Glarea lozoyensis ATCC 20868]|uniref:Proteophosphoglycan ppg4 n=1 Tax=Glarea lozoyensis (strain ATCC 20868 / MF5171) TaxID=1116229 RepID=S3DJ23_GLAL2|nr:uncharacterized protein GLAREA_09312 [Glarea lozoyensis ATCC 20868]EPE37149.1 hypothetical protein GLAREA_09312 [Glarea lozoyensis ATCC 20868]
MGNEQSSPNPRRGQNKLSKPRTNSSGNALNTGTPNSTPGRDNSQSHDSSRKSRYSLFTNDSHGEYSEDGKEKRPKRMSIFRSKSSQARSRAALDVTPEIMVESAEPDPVETPVRRYSVVNHNSPAQSTPDLSMQRPRYHARASLQHLPISSQQSRLSLVAEQQSPPPEKVEIIRNGSFYNREIDSQVVNPPLSSRTNSDTTLYGPTRRRSLLQHGVVTRKEFGSNDPRKSLPSQVKNIEDLQAYYYDPSRSTSSPLANLAAIGQSIPASSPGQRVQTPNDMDYGHIGVYKLGSLRITNGTASPTPSDGRPATATAEEDYLTMGGRQKESNHRHGLSQRSNTLVPADTTKPAWVVHEESPLRQSQKPEQRSLSISTTRAELDPSLALFDFSTNHVNHSPSRSLEFAKQYMEELPLSPFSFDNSSPSPLTPGFQATSKHTAVEDDLFEAEPDSPRNDLSPSAPHSFDSGYGTSASPVVIRGPREYIPKPLAKADSGYSSIASLKSFKKDAAPAVPAKDLQITPNKEISRLRSSIHSTSSSPISKSPSVTQDFVELPALEVMLPFSMDGPPVPAKIPILKGNLLQAQAPVVPPKILERDVASELKVHKRQQSLPNTSVVAVEQDNFTKTSGNKMQKRPKSVQPAVTAPVYTVQAYRSPSDAFSVPSVPAEFDKKLDQRVSGFPVASFPNTYSTSVGLRKSSSKETLGTIFSVGSAEVRDEVEFARLQGKLPPIPSTIPENPSVVPERKPAPNRRATFQASTNNSLPFWKSFDARKISSRSKSRDAQPISPPKTVEQQAEDYENHVTAFNTVASSLGSSPYDIATTIRPPSSGAALRAKSMTSQFEAEAAERFARSRSVSQESEISTVLSSRRSYDSISTVNAIGPSTPTRNGFRRSSREPPPSAHANKPAWKAASRVPMKPQVFVAPQLQDSYDPESRSSTPASGELRQKKPPVSLNNQRKSLPAIRSSRSKTQLPDLPMSPTRAPPAPPTTIPTGNVETLAEVQDPWAAHQNFWSQRRQSAGEALQTRKSFDNSRSGSRRPSMESQTETKAQYGHAIQRASTTQPTQSYGYDEQSWNVHGSNQYQRQPWTGHSTGSHRNFSPQWVQRQTSASYDHTYESDADHLTNGAADYGYYSQADDGYYAQPEQNSVAHHNLPQQIHSVQNSTNDMLVLDRFSGGLGYNYDPNYGLAGSAGTATSGNPSRAPRKGVEASQLYGVDLSDVPVFLQRVRVEQ